MDSSSEEKVARGFDRGVDFKTMKTKLIKAYEDIMAAYNKINDDTSSGTKQKLTRKHIYTVIAMIQLRNGSRISEAVEAFERFIEPGQSRSEKILVKIAKSKSLKHKTDGSEFTTKTRFRKMIYPVNWIDTAILRANAIRHYLKHYDGDLKKRVLDYLSMNYNCNTHSLRYAFINYMLYEQKKEMTVVAKFIGHTGVAQLVRYTQTKESDKIFDIDI